MCPNCKTTLAALKEMREVSAAALRAIVFAQNFTHKVDALNLFEAEIRRLGIKDGFGKRADELIKGVKDE